MSGHYGDSYAVDTVQELLVTAIKLGASDIHCEPEVSGLKIRFRLDGVLFDKTFIEPW